MKDECKIWGRSGAVLSAKPNLDCSENYPDPARSFFDASNLIDPIKFIGRSKTKTRQEMREGSPSGLLSMPSYMGKSRFVALINKMMGRP